MKTVFSETPAASAMSAPRTASKPRRRTSTSPCPRSAGGSGASCARAAPRPARAPPRPRARGAFTPPRARSRRIALTGQFAALDPHLTGRENLVLVAALHGHARRAARRIADGLVERFDAAEFADRRVGELSGGQRRRIDLAASRR